MSRNDRILRLVTAIVMAVFWLFLMVKLTEIAENVLLMKASEIQNNRYDVTAQPGSHIHLPEDCK